MTGSIFDWSKTAAQNDTADADINWQENQLPDTVNGSARQMMARIAEFRDDLGGTATATGTANALLLTANSVFTSYTNGRLLAFKAAADNTGATTINVNGLGAKAIRRMRPNGEAELDANNIKAGGIFILQYSTAANSGAGAWLIVNPTTSNDAATLNGQPGSYYLDAANFTSGAFNVRVVADGDVTGNSGMATATANLGEMEVQGNGTGAAIAAFNRGSYGSYFGLDTDNNWKVGGWSAGANAYKILHEGLSSGNFIGGYQFDHIGLNASPSTDMPVNVIAKGGGTGQGAIKGITVDGSKYGIIAYQNQYSFLGSGLLYNDGDIQASGSVYSGSSYMDSAGNIHGSGWLANFGYSDAITGIINRIESRAEAFAQSYTAGRTAGDLGAYGFMYFGSAANRNTTAAGVNLRYSGTDIYAWGATATGSWRCMGQTNAANHSTNWLRYA